MAKMENLALMAALLSLGVSGILYVLNVIALRRARLVLVTAGGASQEEAGTPYQVWDAGRFATMTTISGLAFLTLSIVARWVVTGHGPFSNMYEYSIVIAWVLRRR